MNLDEMTAAELTEVIEKATARRKELRASERENAKATKEARDAANRGKYANDSMVVFMFNKAETVGKLVRQSEKSVTVEFELNGETVTRYRKYSELVRQAEVEAE